MANTEYPSENNDVPEERRDLSGTRQDCDLDNETLADYLTRTGKPATREVSTFTSWKRPKRPKATFVFPSVPPLF